MKHKFYYQFETGTSPVKFPIKRFKILIFLYLSILPIVYISICVLSIGVGLNEYSWLNFSVAHDFVNLFPGPHGKYIGLVNAGRPDIAKLYSVIFLLGHIIVIPSSILIIFLMKKEKFHVKILNRKNKLFFFIGATIIGSVWFLYFYKNISDSNNIISYKLVNSIWYSYLDICFLFWMYILVFPFFCGILNNEMGRK